MLLKALILENFKGIRERQRIELAPITMLYGPNSAGKSTILHALNYLKEILERKNLDPNATILGGEYLDLGGFENLVHGRDTSESIGLGFELSINTPLPLPEYTSSAEKTRLLRRRAQLSPEQVRPNLLREPWLAETIISGVETIGAFFRVRQDQKLGKTIHFVSEYEVSVNNRVLMRLKSDRASEYPRIDYLSLHHPLFQSQQLPTTGFEAPKHLNAGLEIQNDEIAGSFEHRWLIDNPGRQDSFRDVLFWPRWLVIKLFERAIEKENVQQVAFLAQTLLLRRLSAYESYEFDEFDAEEEDDDESNDLSQLDKNDQQLDEDEDWVRRELEERTLDFHYDNVVRGQEEEEERAEQEEEFLEQFDAQIWEDEQERHDDAMEFNYLSDMEHKGLLDDAGRARLKELQDVEKKRQDEEEQAQSSLKNHEEILAVTHPKIRQLLLSENETWDDYLDSKFFLTGISISPAWGALPEGGTPIKTRSWTGGFVPDDGPISQEEEFEYANNDYHKAVFNDFISSIAVGPIDLFKELLAKLTYIGPIRTVPDRRFNFQKFIEPSRWADGSGAWDTLASESLAGDSSALIESVNLALDGKNSLKTGYELVVTNVLEIDENVPTFLTSDSEPVDPEVIRHWFEENVRGRDVRILLRDSAGLDHSFADVGVGLSQVVPFLVASRQATTGSAIAIEQPELHVHPATQAGIGDVLARSVAETNGEALYLIETHSEHILLRLLRRIRETADGSLESPELGLRAGDLSINYVESKDGRSVIKNLRVDSDGEFMDHWPNGFFEERIEETL